MADIHKKAFDAGTQIKLHIVEEYLKEWLPVYLKKNEPFWKEIFIYDFFAGEGSDSDGKSGSPLIILDQIKDYCNDIIRKDFKVTILFNEFIKSKANKLGSHINKQVKNCKENTSGKINCPNSVSDIPCPFNLIIENEDFQTLFARLYPEMINKNNSKLPRFMFLDQYGIKHITKDIFQKLIALERTDFIFFISSSFARRFIELPEFKNYIELTKQDFDESKSYHIHKVIFNYYKSQIPPEKSYYLAPFSIKKDKNLYGLIYGSNHPLGIEKFLNICWNINSQTGDANFDIDNEKINPLMPSLFEEFNIPTKIQDFERELREKISKKEIKTNKEIYSFTFDMGCLPKHANKVIKELKKEGLISKDLKTSSQDIHRLEITKI